jgi:acetyltransferase-like isoleucine patch superfamily enzyme/putative methionine-R-sulfoxide reductase with GAF domain
MTEKRSALKWMRLKEVLVTNLVGWIPTVGLGVVWRNLLYGTIFKRIGKALFIQDGVEFIGANNIEIGNRVYLFRGVRINARDNNCRILIGDRVALERGIDIAGGENCQIEIGEQTFIGPYTCIGGPGNVTIGKHCLIAAHTGIVANNHIFVDPVQNIRDQGVTGEGIVIEDDCWLGYGVKVLDGVTIGQGSVIGAGAVVTKDIPPYSVAVGVPARAIASRTTKSVKRSRDREYIEDSRLVTLNSALIEMEKTALKKQDMQVFNHNVSAQLVFENMLQALLESIRQVMQVDTIAVLLRTEGGQQLTVRATLGLEEEITTKVKIPLGRGFAGQIAARRELMIVEDLSKIEVVSPILRNKGLHSMLGVPLLVKDRVIGVFHVGTFRHRQFTNKDAQVLQSAAERIGIAIEPLWRFGYPNSDEQCKPI